MTGPPVVTTPTDFFTGGGVTGVGVAVSEVPGCHKTLQLHPAPHACAPAPSGTQRPPREGTQDDNAGDAAEPGNLSWSSDPGEWKS